MIVWLTESEARRTVKGHCDLSRRPAYAIVDTKQQSVAEAYDSHS